jgi:light-harvesting complex II chlorophyll a/b binding protein 5
MSSAVCVCLHFAKNAGPDRRIYLPEGLLNKSDIPAYLTGEVPGE